MTDTLESLREENRWLRSELGMVENLQLVAQLRTQLRISAGAAKILEALSRVNGRIVDKDWLREAIGSDATGNVVEVRICQIRQALGFDAIETVRSCGVRLGSPGIAAIEAAKSSLVRPAALA